MIIVLGVALGWLAVAWGDRQGCPLSPFFHEFWHKRAVFQQSSFGRLTAGNDVVATILITLFFSILFSSPFPLFSSPLLPFLIEGVLGSKSYLAKVA